MNIEEFEEIMESGEYNSDSDVDSTVLGIILLSKYCKRVIEGADHDIIYGCDIDELIEKGITKEEVKLLGEYGWHVNDEYLACYV